MSVKTKAGPVKTFCTAGLSKVKNLGTHKIERDKAEYELMAHHLFHGNCMCEGSYLVVNVR